ncbi:META domain-containing protein [Variovorax sp. J22R24]|uniref:META domain-containing protein n=1 Tax=Variovorax gracilis TaxID=3053502 RepID=UPI002577EBE7|nr:META domain-containing protein [Variovorax sp. J22R24]MDM0104281.1 META domain-containing protein [Variovorax sp. J22R24]
MLVAALAACLHAQPVRWRGEFVYFADSAAFTDCASGKRWPVAMTGDYLALERAYLHWHSAPTAPLLVNFDGRLEIREPMEGPAREHMIVERFASVEPGNTCEMVSTGKQKQKATAALKDTYWKLAEIGGAPVAMLPGQQREVRITLASEGSRLSGFSGCNQLIGSYEAKDQTLRFQAAGTMMACEPPLMELERKVHVALGATSAYRIEGERLIILGADGKTLAGFDAVYLR